MRGPAVAVQAIHPASWLALDIRQGRALSEVLTHLASGGCHFHVRNLLAVIVQGDELDLTRTIHVPVNAGSVPCARDWSSDVKTQNRPRAGVRLVIRMFVHDFENVADEPIRTMAAFAGAL